MLALAGYQNRDKLSELFKAATGTAGSSGTATQSSPLGGIFGNLGGKLGGAGAGGLLGGGLNELVGKFRQAGQSDTAESWIRTGPNTEISPPDLMSFGLQY